MTAHPSSESAHTFCQVDLSALCANLDALRSRVGPAVEVLAVVKDDAYGHGAVESAQALAAHGVRRFGVATIEEGARLRRSGLDADVVVLGSFYPEDAAALFEHSLSPVISNLAVLRSLEAFGAERGLRIACHLKVDTGMGRLGLLADHMEEWLPELRGLRAVELQGIMSHFAESEEPDSPSCRGQLAAFRRTLARLRAEGHAPALVHMANSAAVVGVPEAHFDMVRPGGMLYGIFSHPPLARRIRLTPVLTWKTRVLQLKKVPGNFRVSYGGTFVTRRESLIATLPVGYAAGYKRSLSNKAAVLVRGRRAPVAGRVTMDLTMVDVTDIGGVQSGDEVVLLGAQGGEAISAEEMAGWADTISYEITTSISPGIPRTYIREKEERGTRGQG